MSPQRKGSSRPAILHLLQHAVAGMMVAEVAGTLKLTPDGVNKHLVTLRTCGLAHISSWAKPTTPGRLPAVWKYGPGIDAPRPPTARYPDGPRMTPRLMRLHGVQHAHQSVFVGGINPWTQTARAPQ